MAELAGVPEDQIRRMGHWNQQAMEKHYLTALPRKAMRALSGKSISTATDVFRDSVQQTWTLLREERPYPTSRTP